MAYDKETLYNQALEAAEKENCYFIEQLVSFMPCSKQTFYDHFPIKSDELDSIKAVIERNRVSTKSKMYTKWFESENASLQIGLMKLISTEDEADRLNGTRVKQEITDKRPMVIKSDEPEELEEFANELDGDD